MIDFQRLTFAQKEAYEQILFTCPPRGCEYSFANQCLWGRQEAAFLHGCVAFFSHFYGRSVYPYPIGGGDRRAVLELVMQDARNRGIPCRLTGLTVADKQELEDWFPGKFLIRSSRDSFDYVYDIHDLADLKGRKFQKKRNHVNKFRQSHPDYQVLPLNACNLPLAQHMVNDWFSARMKADPQGDYLLENLAMVRAFRYYGAFGFDGILLTENDRVLAVTVGSRLSADTFDIHFEKAREDADGAYPTVNQEFARYLRLKYPELAYLNREDDMGLEGLRKAKLSYNPHRLTEKYTATLAEDLHDLPMPEA